jgi:hypothetical protein
MNTPIPPPPRFLCRAVRGWQSLFGKPAAGRIAGPGSRHVAHCADCRRYFNAAGALDAALRRDALRQRENVPSDLEQSILRAVRQSARPPQRTQRTRPGFVPLAAAGAVACVALVLSLLPRTPATGQAGLAPGSAATAVAAVADPASLWTKLKPQAETLLQGDPLQDEAHHVYADAQSAIHFLALNFLPGEPAQPAGAETGSMSL